MKNKNRYPLISAIAIVLLCSCNLNSQQTLPATEDEPTSLPSSEATNMPTEADTLSATLTTPIIPLSQEGPWLLIYSDQGALVANADGTGLTQIANSNDYGGRLKLSISPRGGRLAFFYPPFIPPDMEAFQADLFMVEFPKLTTTSLTQLYSDDLFAETESTEPVNNPYALEETIYSALYQWNNLAWSPDGDTLAFASAQDGPSVDLYAYSATEKTINRLTSGSTQTILINWSPDGQYIVSAGARDMHAFSGGSNGPELDAIWIVKPDGSDLHSIYTYTTDEQGPPNLIGWVNNRAYVENYNVIGCGRNGLTFVDIQVPTQYALIPGVFSSLALDPVTGTILVLIPNITDEYSYMRDCGSTLEPGWYLISVYDARNPQKISFEVPVTPDNFEYSISWSPEARLFFIFTGVNVYAVDLQGQITFADLPNTYDYALKPSPDGSVWASYGESGLWISSPDSPIIKVTDSVSDFIWTPDSSALLFVSEKMLYQASAPDYQPIQLTGPITIWDYPPYEGWTMKWIMP